jgi:oligopeptidase A
MRQLGFSSVDLLLHTEYSSAKDGSVLDYCRREIAPYSPVQLPAEFAMITGFSHLFSDPVGYAAGYYSYKWAEVLDADAFTRFQNEGIFSSKVGAEFRDRVISRGNSEDPLKLFKDFMGREPNVDALLIRAGLLTA